MEFERERDVLLELDILADKSELVAPSGTTYGLSPRLRDSQILFT